MQDDSKNQPNFTRGPEIEITTRQDVEHLKALLAQAKINIPTIALDRAIVMYSDINAHHPGIAKIKENLMVSSQFNVLPVQRRVGKLKGKQEKLPDNHILQRDNKGTFKVYDYGNYPLVHHTEAFGDKELRPKGGMWRLKHPCDANWAPRDIEEELEQLRLKKEKE